MPGLDGGPGNDKITGQTGNDEVNGGDWNLGEGEDAGQDYLGGGDGNDFVCDGICYASERGPSSGSDDRLLGGPGRDRIMVTGGNDVEDRGGGNDFIGTTYFVDPDYGTTETDRGSDTYLGGDGDDNLSATDGVAGNDTVNGQGHRNGDECSADERDTLRNCEN